jgi:glutaminyl-tRNA synthetase
MTEAASSNPSDFIRDIIDNDLKINKNDGRVATRFPPEPNGYIHIGHAKSVCLNFGITAQYNGTCNLRLDDTDPAGESMEYVESIIRNIHWVSAEHCVPVEVRLYDRLFNI